jgi:hypothetical protein
MANFPLQLGKLDGKKKRTLLDKIWGNKKKEKKEKKEKNHPAAKTNSVLN